MRLPLFALFIAASTSQAVLIGAYWVMGMRPNPYLTWSALALTGICVALMFTIAIATQDVKTRWLSIGLTGVVTLAFSALTIPSWGLLTGPVAVALVVVSIIMLLRNRRSAPTQE